MDNKSKISYFCIFDYKTYIFLLSKVHTNKLVLHFELIIFFRYKDNGYCFIYHTQENIILCSIHAIFDEKLFSQCTNFHVKEYKLYDKLLDKISLEIELSVPGSSEKDRLALVPIPYIPIPLIQNNSPTSSPFFSYKFLSSLPTLMFEKPIVEIEEDNDVDSDVEI